MKSSTRDDDDSALGGILEEKQLGELRMMGLTSLEAKTYVGLLRTGPCNARTITSLIGVNRVDVYRTLRSLVRRGLVETALGTPTTYIASPPEIVIKTLVEFQERRLMSLKSRMKDLESWLSSIKGADADVAVKNREMNYTANFVMRASTGAFEHHQQILRECKKDVLFVWSALGLEMHFQEGTLEVFEECRKRGVSIHGLVEEKAKYSAHHEEWRNCVEFRYLASIEGMLRYIIVDHSELVLAVNEMPYGINSLQSLSTKNSTIIKGFETTFNSLWNVGERFD